MQLYIDNRSGAPIYDQIYSQIKDAILSGQVTEGEALPIIRALGKGSFVAPKNTELLREENLRKIESHMQEIRRLANACRLTEQELDDMWRLQKEEAE